MTTTSRISSISSDYLLNAAAEGVSQVTLLQTQSPDTKAATTLYPHSKPTNVCARQYEIEKALPVPPKAKRGDYLATGASLVRAFGLQAILILTLGSFALLGALGFLVFLWFAPRSNPTWRHIAVNNWMTRTVTLTALGIRTIVGFQVVVCSAMIAALYLQRGVPFRDAATVSLARQSGGALWKFIRTPRLAPTRWWLPLLIGLTSIGSQFISTLLIGDLTPSSVLGFQHSMKLPINLTEIFESNIWNPDDPFITKPLSYPTFAEYSDTLKPRDAADTGPLLRAILPEPDPSSRASLQNYEGYATVFDGRVFCTAPAFDDLNLTGTPDGFDFGLAGLAVVKDTIPELVYNTNGSNHFSCAGPQIASNLYPNDFGTSVSPMDPRTGGLVNSLMPQFNSSLHWYYQDVPDPDNLGRGYWTAHEFDGVSPNARVGRPYLVVNFVNTTWQVTGDQFTFLTWNITGASSWNFKQDGPWTIITAKNSTATAAWSNGGSIHHDFQIQASICFDATGVQKMIPIRASRNNTRVVSEPADIVHALHQLDLTDIQREDPETRSILNLDPSSVNAALRTELQETNPPSFPTAFDIYPSWFQWNSKERADLYGIFQYPDAARIFSYQPLQGLGATSVSLDRVELFQQAMNNTKSPALALQAQQHIVLTATLYHWLPDATGVQASNETNMVDSPAVPTLSVGLTAVCTIVLFHISLILGIATLFARAEKVTFLNRNTWQVIAQMVTSETEDVLREATILSDEEVGRALERMNMGKRVVRLGKEVDGVGDFKDCGGRVAVG
jgi:hypothetical protein